MDLDEISRELSSMYRDEVRAMQKEEKRIARQRKMLEGFVQRHPENDKARAMLQRFNETHPA